MVVVPCRVEWQRELAERRQEAADSRDNAYWEEWQTVFEVAKQSGVLALCWKPHLAPVPPAAWFASGITAVRFPGMGLAKLPNAFDKRHKHVESLILTSNRLYRLPKSVQCLKHLKEINLTKNVFKRLPKWVCTMKSLTCVELSANKLSRVGKQT